MMRQIHFKAVSAAEIKCLIATLCLGLVTGCCAGILVMGRKVHYYYNTTEIQKAQLADLRSRNELLEQSLQENRYRVVKRLSIKVEGVDEATAKEIQKRVTGLVSNLIGKEISQVDPLLVEAIVNDQTAVVNGREYVLRVRSSHVWETMTLVISANLRIPDRTPK